MIRRHAYNKSEFRSFEDNELYSWDVTNGMRDKELTLGNLCTNHKKSNMLPCPVRRHSPVTNGI